jgi:hypothetical protein
MKEIAEVAKQAFSKSFDSVLEKLKTGFNTVLTDIFQGLGAGSELISGIMEGAMAIGFLLLSRIKSETETTYNQIEDGVEQIQEKTRGLIVGDVSVSLQSVVEKFSTAQVPVTIRLDKLIEIGQGILASVSGGKVASSARENAYSIGILEGY